MNKMFPVFQKVYMVGLEDGNNVYRNVFSTKEKAKNYLNSVGYHQKILEKNGVRTESLLFYNEDGIKGCIIEMEVE